MMSRYGTCLLLMGLILPFAVLLGGCGGDLFDGGYDPDYPRYKELTLILRVQNGQGEPLGGANVYVDGMEDENRTDFLFYALGAGYPEQWRGWLANWTSDAYEAVMDYPGDRDQFQIRVEKDGYTHDTTLVKISDDEPRHIFIRDIMTLYRITDVSAQTARAPHEAQVLPAPTGLKLKTPQTPLKLIGSTADSHQ